MPTYNKQDPETIQALFNDIAKNYDVGNAVLSFQMHRLWNRKLIREAVAKNPPAVYLDLCCGTGEIGLSYLKNYQDHPSKLIFLDFSQEMLECAKEKAKKVQTKTQIDFLQADAMQIPLSDQSVNCATVAYGIRNVKDPAKCIQEVYRVLQHDGIFAILELTRPANSFLRFGHKLYLKSVLPTIGRLLTSNKNAYQYLCDSIHSFIPPEILEQFLIECKFREIQRISLAGGIATLLIAKK